MTAADWIDDLERKAKAATPGPWSADGYGSGQQVTGATGTIFADKLALHEDAKFIAAADPDTILRLIKQAQNYNAEADRHASRVVAMEAENEDLTAERDALAARLAAVEALLADGPDTWEGYDTRDIGHAFLAESVLDFTADLRAALAAPTDTTKEN